MNPAKRKWVGLIVICAAPAISACRDREPVPAYNENLGSPDLPLLPAAVTMYDPELGKSNKKVEIPKRPEPGDPASEGNPAAAPTGPETEGTPEAAPVAENAATHGIAPTAKDTSTSGE